MCLYTYLESIASGVIVSDPVIIAIARPGASLVSTSRVAWMDIRIHTIDLSTREKLYAHLWSDIPAGKSSTTRGKNKTQFQVVAPFLQYLLQIKPLVSTYHKWTVVQDIILPVYPAHCLVHRLSRHVLLLYSVCRITTHDTYCGAYSTYYTVGIAGSSTEVHSYPGPLLCGDCH